MLDRVTLLCFFGSYLVALALEATRLLKRVPINQWAALLVTTAGFVAQTAYLLVRSRTADLPPLLSSTHDWLLVLAWLAILMYLFVIGIDRRLGIGLFVLPIVLVLVGAAHFVDATLDVRLNSERGWGMLHASLLVLGVAGIGLGFVLSLMYLVQHRRLKHKQPWGEGLELPSLERLSRWNWWAVVISVPLLTLGMAIGVGLSIHSQGMPQAVRLSEPSILISGLVWGVMIVLFIWLLMSHHLSGKLVAWRTAWAFGFLLVTLIVLEVFNRGGVHGRAAMVTDRALLSTVECFSTEGACGEPPDSDLTRTGPL